MLNHVRRDDWQPARAVRPDSAREITQALSAPQPACPPTAIVQRYAHEPTNCSASRTRSCGPVLKRYADGDATPAWDLFLDGALVASEIVSRAEAQLELDQIAWYALFGEAPLAADALLTEEALGLSLAVFNRLFTTLKVQEKARIALQTIITPGIYTITTHGGLSVMASSGKGKTSYAVTAQQTPLDETGTSYAVTMGCECKDFYARAHEHGGVCKHVAARLLLFLAQHGVAFLKHLRDALDTQASDVLPHGSLETVALSPIDNDQSIADAPADADAQPLAFVEIDATDLLAALRLVQRGGTPVIIRAEHGTLHLTAAPTELTIPGLDGDGAAAVQLDDAAFGRPLRAAAPTVRTVGVLAIFIVLADGQVILDGRGETRFSAVAQGTPVPGTPATEAPLPAPTTEALFELFTLLEQHEPPWYLKRHYRIACEALQARRANR